METAYRFDKHGHYMNAEQIMLDPTTFAPLIPDDCVAFAPDENKLKTSWAVLNSEHTEWEYQTKPTTAKECIDISVKHEDQCPWAYEMRDLFEKLCAADSEHYRVVRDDDLTQTVEAIPEKTLEEVKEQKHSELKSTMQAKRQSLKVDYDYDQFDANETAQSNMNTLLQAFNLGATSVSIRSANEVTHTFNQAHCNELALLMADAVNKLYAEYWKYKDALAKCETVDAVNEIKWG